MNNDLWRIYDSNDNIIKLVLDSTIKNGEENLVYSYSNKSYYYNDTIKDSLAYYLNNTYYNSLSYKDLILENTYINGLYSKENSFNYKDIALKEVKTKVSIPSIDDILFNNEINNYFTSTGKLENKEAIYVEGADGSASAKLITTNATIVPCISINKDNLTLGTGDLSDPFRTE